MQNYYISTREKASGKFYYVRYSSCDTGKVGTAKSIDSLAVSLGINRHIM